jgi:hypothetical protein
VSSDASTFIQQHVRSGDITEKLQHLPYADRFLPHRDQILTKVSELTASLASFVVARLKDVTKSTLNLVVQAALMFYAMYFFLMDGPHLLKITTEYLPLSKTERAQLIERFTAVSIATIKSTVVIGFVQGILGGAGFAVAGISAPFGAPSYCACRSPASAPRSSGCPLAAYILPDRALHPFASLRSTMFYWWVDRQFSATPAVAGSTDARAARAALDAGRALGIRADGIHHRPGDRFTVHYIVGHPGRTRTADRRRRYGLIVLAHFERTP